MITPTVGRIVWYHPPKPTPYDQPMAAIVTHVWSDTCVNLAIFCSNGRPMPEPPTSILLVQDDNPVPTGGNYCEWMPYQIGQANKYQPVPLPEPTA